jgi:ADP-ribose pyrophosphatase YjhB (NUDIX family)
VQFCSACGGRLFAQVLGNDPIRRLVCVRCQAVHYQNPKILVSCLAHFEERLLMCRRAQEPGRGLWSVPAGFMEINETIELAAARETQEETGLQINPLDLDLYGVLSLPHLNQVYITLRIELKGWPRLTPGPEALEVALLREQDLKASDWAFAGPMIQQESAILFGEIRARQFGIHKSGLSNSYHYENRTYPLAPLK